MYTIKQLAGLSGLTPRTLRHYDATGLLCPRRDRKNGYRLYGPDEVDRLQQILLYREMGLPLEEIGRILDAPDFDRAGALREHLERLLERRQEMDLMIHAVRSTLDEIKGGDAMTGKEKFEGMKRLAVEENEAAYGGEARRKYGDAAVDGSNARLAGMSRREWDQMKEEETGYLEALRRAMEADDVDSGDAREAVRLHAAWLAHYWPEGAVTPQAHTGLAEMYAQDARFRAFYEKTAPGCAAFFSRAVKAYYASVS